MSGRRLLAAAGAVLLTCALGVVVVASAGFLALTLGPGSDLPPVGSATMARR